MEASTNAELRIWTHHIFCRICGSIMVKREPRNGKHFEIFWGCREFPECKGARAILSDGSIEPDIDPLDDLSWI